MKFILTFAFLLFASAFAYEREAGISVHCESSTDMNWRSLTVSEASFLGHRVEDVYKLVHKRLDGGILENIHYKGASGTGEAKRENDPTAPASFLGMVNHVMAPTVNQWEGWTFEVGLCCRQCPNDGDGLDSISAEDKLASTVAHNSWEKILAITLAAGPYNMFKGVTSCSIDLTMESTDVTGNNE